MNAIPPSLNAAIQRYQAGSQAGSLAGKTAQMSERYRHGGRSDGALDFNAYLTARLPATFAAVAYCLAELARRHPQFSPLSLLDAGSGPGTVSWAVAASYPSISAVTFLDNNERFLELARSLAAQSEYPALRQARALDGDINNLPPELSADLVIAAYALAELPVSQSGKAAVSLWWACKNTLLIIEPGTPQGFARIAQARTALMAEGAHLLAPCTHMNSCPVADPDWCHFSVRLARSREHMHAKKARVPYEDEKFSYMIASRPPVPLLGARILARPHESKAEITFKLCTESGLDLHGVASRDKAAYKRARKLEWGDLFE
ncbi:MAG TPA: small ribosomal subunit Rsm22 family protein [Aestuariivirga sp.]